MRILIAEDDVLSRRMLQELLERWGYNVTAVCDGEAALKNILGENPPQLAILDWIMPGLEGIDICRRIREDFKNNTIYIIMLTIKEQKDEIISALEAGANDYIIKPFNISELHARIQVGKRVVELQESLEERVKVLEDAILHIKRLQGLIPICSYCKKIRNDKNYWEQIETYISEHSEAEFTHGICPECYEKIKSNLKNR